MYSKIISTGSYLPSKIVTNDDLIKQHNLDSSNDWIIERTGIKQRHFCESNELTSDLAVKCAQIALQKAKLQSSDIDAIICATSTADLTFPSTATIIQRKLGIKNAFAFDLQAVCSGFVYALSVADSLIIAKRAKRVLVIGAEVLSKILNWQDRNTCVLFGDGAGCVILEAVDKEFSMQESGIIGVDILSDGTYTDDLKTTGGPTSGDGKAGVITMNGQTVYKHAVNNLESIAKLVLKKYKVEQSEIDWLVPHQANIRIIKSTADKLHLPLEKVIITVDQHANTSAASIPLALDAGVNDGRIKKGQLLLLEAMGAGFTWGAALLRF